MADGKPGVSLSATVRRTYLAPHPGWASRTAMLAFSRQIPSGPDSPGV